MATVTLTFYPFNVATDTLYWPYEVVAADPKRISLSSKQVFWEHLILSGDFTVGPNGAVSGTVTSLLQTGPETLTDSIRIDNLSADAATLLDLVTNSPGPQRALEWLLSGDDTIKDTGHSDTLAGFGGNDTILAGGGDDTIIGGAGDDTIDGGSGVDTASYSGPAADYAVERTATGLMVRATRGDAGTDSLERVEIIRFDDQIAMLVEVDGDTGVGWRLYRAAFDRAPDAGGLSFWSLKLSAGMTAETIAEAFIRSPEYEQLYGTGLSNRELVAKYYEHVLHRMPDEAGLAFWIQVLDSHAATNAQVLAGISESPENVELSAALIGNGLLITDPVVFT